MFKKSHLGIGGLALIGLLFIGIMLLAGTLLRGAQLDLTQDRLYSLSDGTKRIIGNLKEPVNLYFFFSEKAAANRHEEKNYGKRVRELLEELVSRSNGKLTLKVIDPQPFTDEEDRIWIADLFRHPHFDVHRPAHAFHTGFALPLTADIEVTLSPDLLGGEGRDRLERGPGDSLCLRRWRGTGGHR